MFNKIDKEGKQRFGIRKLSVGVCSVLLSTLLLGIEENTPKADAATTNNTSIASDAVDATENPQNQNTYVTTNKVKSESVTEDSSSNKNDVANDNNQQDSQSPVVQNTQDKDRNPITVQHTSETKDPELTADNIYPAQEKSSETDSIKNTGRLDKTKITNNGPSDSDQNIQDVSDQLVNNASKSVTNNTKDSNKTTDSDLEKLKQQAKENDGKNLDAKSRTSLPNTSNVSNFQALAALTKENIVEADQIKENAAVTIPSSDGRYTLYISRNTWGNTTDGNQPAKILLSGNVLAGDTVSISIPSYGIVGVTQPTIDASYGSASIKDVGNDKVVTYNFTTSGVINPIIIINPDNGYGAKPAPMQITQPTVKDITWTVNGVEQTSAEFHIDVNPVWNPKFSLSKPNPNSTDQNALKKMIPNYESIYQLAINETNGVAPGQDYQNSLPYPSQKINSAVNYGTVITIPMPKGYVLDESATMQLNNFGDKTTITQEGNNVIITVPEGSGTQNWNSGGPYQLVGSYNIPMPNTATTYTADAPITIVQKLNNDGSQTKTWTGPTVSQEFYGANDQIPLGQMPLYAKAAYDGNQLLNNGHKQIVAYFGATNESIASYSDYSSNFTFNFDEGLGVTGLKTPTIPGTSNYKYTITYADGTTSEGQVNAGDTITGTGVITNIAVSPDNFERDQSTATNLPGNSFANQTTESVNAFEAYGAVPDTVKPGTQLVANLTFTGTIQQGNITKYLTSKIQVDQTVVSSADLTSSSGIFGYQNNTATGQSNVGYLSVYAGGGQTNN
ncbi:MAG: YSIRK-type signal peptide-containing protein, partial [Lactobacillus sp.]|nr:YSIRK-type signal peptide-containing protein [Lactobacillus sp.]